MNPATNDATGATVTTDSPFVTGFGNSIKIQAPLNDFSNLGTHTVKVTLTAS
jgi:hypothetical protein